MGVCVCVWNKNHRNLFETLERMMGIGNREVEVEEVDVIREDGGRGING